MGFAGISPPCFLNKREEIKCGRCVCVSVCRWRLSLLPLSSPLSLCVSSAGWRREQQSDHTGLVSPDLPYRTARGRTNVPQLLLTPDGVVEGRGGCKDNNNNKKEESRSEIVSVRGPNPGQESHSAQKIQRWHTLLSFVLFSSPLSLSLPL